MKIGIILYRFAGIFFSIKNLSLDFFLKKTYRTQKLLSRVHKTYYALDLSRKFWGANIFLVMLYRLEMLI